MLCGVRINGEGRSGLRGARRAGVAMGTKTRNRDFPSVIYQKKSGRGPVGTVRDE